MQDTSGILQLDLSGDVASEGLTLSCPLIAFHQDGESSDVNITFMEPNRTPQTITLSPAHVSLLRTAMANREVVAAPF